MADALWLQVSKRTLSAFGYRNINRIDSWTAGAWRHGLPNLVTGGEKGDMREVTENDRSIKKE
jgi:hypothetical protein